MMSDLFDTMVPILFTVDAHIFLRSRELRGADPSLNPAEAASAALVELVGIAVEKGPLVLSAGHEPIIVPWSAEGEPEIGGWWPAVMPVTPELRDLYAAAIRWDDGISAKTDGGFTRYARPIPEEHRRVGYGIALAAIAGLARRKGWQDAAEAHVAKVQDTHGGTNA
jgi:hypothetical protein